MKTLKIFLCLCLLGVKASASVWPAQQTWSTESEKAFAEFITKISPDIFANPHSSYYGISTDCAEAVYVLRLIFAYENKLEFAMKDPTGSGLITSGMSRWDGLEPMDRLKHFIAYVKQVGSSQTLPNDTYPVRINKDYVTAGVVFLNTSLGGIPGLSTSGHSEYVRKIEDTGYIVFMSSTVPQAVRRLNITMVETLVPQNHDSGFRRFKQPSFYNRTNRELPGFSEEQFQMGSWSPGMSSRHEIFTWHEAIRNHLRDRPATSDESMRYLVQNICSLLQARVGLVQAAWDHQKTNGLRCLSSDSSEYDDYSTPERDTRILDNYSLLEELLKVQDLRSRNDHLADRLRQSPGTGGRPLTPVVKTEIYDMTKAKSSLEACKIEWSPGRTLNAFDLYHITKAGHLDSDPNYRPAVRWGVEIPHSRGEDCK